MTEKETSTSIIKKLQATLIELEDVKVRLEKEIIEKDDHVRKLAIELAANDISETDTQNPALLATIESLETIIKQKEETISRLQELLKECQEDHTKEIIELQKNAKVQHFDTKEKRVLLFIKIKCFFFFLILCQPTEINNVFLKVLGSSFIL